MSSSASSPSTRTAFLDRDGTINVKAAEGDYVTSWDRFRFLPGAEEAVTLLRGAGWRVIVVSNQRGVALGRMTAADVEEIHTRMQETAPVDAVYWCPHDRGVCECRKPGTKMFTDAAADFGLDLASAVVIGDAESDMEGGRRIGARTILVGEPPRPSLLDAVRGLLSSADPGPQGGDRGGGDQVEPVT
jgi:histidinol-phosphate phosphatase family protein